MLCLAEVRVTTEQDLAEPRPPAQRDGLIEPPGRTLRGRPVATTIHQEQRLLRVRERDYKRVVAPHALVRDVHAVLALSARRSQRSVSVEHRFVEELRGLLSPDRKANLIDRAHQVLDGRLREPPAEVPRGRRIGDPLRPKSVEIHLVVAAQLNVLQTRPSTQRVVGDVQHVVRLVVRQMHLEHLDSLVEGGDQPRASREQVHHPDPADPQSAISLRHVIVDVAGSEHGNELVGPDSVSKPVLDSSLAVRQLPAYRIIHSKCLLCTPVCESGQLIARKIPRHFEYFQQKRSSG